jgi:hypothetical protein
MPGACRGCLAPGGLPDADRRGYPGSRYGRGRIFIASCLIAKFLRFPKFFGFCDHDACRHSWTRTRRLLCGRAYLRQTRDHHPAAPRLAHFHVYTVGQDGILRGVGNPAGRLSGTLSIPRKCPGSLSTAIKVHAKRAIQVAGDRSNERRLSLLVCRRVVPLRGVVGKTTWQLRQWSRPAPKVPS